MARHDVLNIEVDRASHVEIEFEDGVIARFELAPLRLACPCAECNSRRQKDEPVSKSVMEGGPISITDAELAGNWGLSLDWSDGPLDRHLRVDRSAPMDGRTRGRQRSSRPEGVRQACRRSDPPLRLTLADEREPVIEAQGSLANLPRADQARLAPQRLARTLFSALALRS